MALPVPVLICLLFKAMTALTEDARVVVTPDSIVQQTDYVEGLIALKFSHPCLEDHNSYCINGVCAFHHELEKAICRCLKLKSPYNICSGGKPL
ncbi:PREDICTED: epigen isoform X4 [Dipodomys ordii]|uniref:Epigen isoform X4 n=1 Tax=Dipodomys ordii TaxID=10020 RepID=A0A1S3FGA5_DIPOR|nr:PREDICTED: epigen isoform X4 [Dipodomys ordii]